MLPLVIAEQQRRLHDRNALWHHRVGTVLLKMFLKTCGARHKGQKKKLRLPTTLHHEGQPTEMVQCHGVYHPKITMQKVYD